MAGTRAYVRGSNGRFAGKGPGTKVTQGRAGGFANGAFRARVAQGRLAGAKSPSGAAPASRRSRAAKTVNAAAHNKKLQKVAFQLALTGAVLAHNKRKFGTTGLGIKPIVTHLKTATAPQPKHLSTR